MDTQQGTFGMRNFGAVDLGDRRRTQRLVESVDRMCRHPGGTLPDKLNCPADLRAFYRLMNRPEVTHAVLMNSHTQHTRDGIAAVGQGVVLIVHDATELDYTTKTHCSTTWARSAMAAIAATSATTAWRSVPTPPLSWG